MARMGWIRRVWLTRFSKPAADRPLFRHVLRKTPTRLIEIGIDSLDRSARLLRVATAVAPTDAVHYVGLDRFEGRLAGEPQGATLKQAHQRLHGLARVQLLPGNADTSLARMCNHLGVFDVVVIAAVTDERHLERSWFFIQRITNASSLVLRETAAGGDRSWEVVAKPRIDELASRAVLRRAG
jgi:hypothetical protein